jgi:hypothetical protein
MVFLRIRMGSSMLIDSIGLGMGHRLSVSHIIFLLAYHVERYHFIQHSLLSWSALLWQV